MANKPATENKNRLEKELRQIRNLLILLTLQTGACSDEVYCATGMGAPNIRAMFPIKRGKGKRAKSA